MTKPLSRAIPFAILALIVSAIVSAIVLIFLVGVPGSRDAAAEFQRQAISRAVGVDLIVGGLVALVGGWLAARPFRGRRATMTGLMTGLVLILLDLAIVLLFGNSERLNLATMAASYADKLAAATLGGFLASRGRSLADNDEPERVSLDKE
jgi:glucan phosphoethanolaminetransferase (alkaline phosphatase superfamily)